MLGLQYSCLCHYRGYDDDEDPYWRRLSQRRIPVAETARRDSGRSMGGEMVLPAGP